VRHFVTALIVVAGLPGHAIAQDPEECEPLLLRAPYESTPAVSAPGVTLGAPIRVKYPEGYFEDPVIAADPATSIVVFEGDDSGPEVPGTARAIGDSLVFTPDAPYAPDTRYAGVAFGLDADFVFNFRTGSSFDMGPPQLGPLQEVVATRIDEDSCDAASGSYRIDVSFGGATDDGPPGDIEYLLYLSRGPEVDAPELRAVLRNQSAGDQIMAFIAEASEVASPVCVSIVAVDGVGNLDDTAAPLCDDPIQGSFFEPLCSASPGQSSSGPIAWLALVAVVLFWRRRTPRSRAGLWVRPRSDIT
jgi:MYXO-CTERM domain-containing protein